MARTYRFFLRNSSPPAKDFDLLAQTEPEIVFQISTVLRGKTSDEVVLLTPDNDEAGVECRFKIVEANKHHVKLEFVDSKENKNELPFTLRVLLCLPNKPDKLDFMLQKAVEVGVQEIVLLESDYSQMKHHLKPERIQKIIMEAAEQCERAKISSFEMGGKLHNFLESNQKKETILVAMERMGLAPLADAQKEMSTLDSVAAIFKKNIQQFNELNLLIGPEGGFSEAEKEYIKTLGLQCFSLGPRILRMETAMLLSSGLASLLDLQ
ncbi:MAG: 16S rRNA (uracil(1498)-N(3))-methyltransferase [Candidatus Gracilibacteria bacterium]|jgi:16S rRNA (uracil1498-N3)-methyltransferase